MKSNLFYILFIIIAFFFLSGNVFASEAKEINQYKPDSWESDYVKAKTNNLSMNPEVQRHSLKFIIGAGNLKDSLKIFIENQGYAMAWGVNDENVYVTEYPIGLRSISFVDNLEYIKKSLNQQGFDFDFIFYNNKIVQVIEKNDRI